MRVYEFRKITRISWLTSAGTAICPHKISSLIAKVPQTPTHRARSQYVIVRRSVPMKQVQRRVRRTRSVGLNANDVIFAVDRANWLKYVNRLDETLHDLDLCCSAIPMAQPTLGKCAD